MQIFVAVVDVRGEFFGCCCSLSSSCCCKVFCAVASLIVELVVIATSFTVAFVLAVIGDNLFIVAFLLLNFTLARPVKVQLAGPELEY